MKKFSTLAVILFITLSLPAQVSIWKDTVWVNNLTANMPATLYTDTLYNNSNTPDTFTWFKSNESLQTGLNLAWLSDSYADYPNNTLSKSLIIPANSKSYIGVYISTGTSISTQASSVTISTTHGPITFAFFANPLAITQSGLRKEDQLYPNPCNQQLTITIDKSSKAKYVSLISATGKFMNTIPVEADNSYTLPMHNLATGTYYLKFADNNKQALHYKEFIHLN